MARKRVKPESFDLNNPAGPEQTAIPAGPEPAAVPAGPEPAAVRPETRKVIAIRLTEAGKIDLDGMRPATVESLKAALSGSPLMSPKAATEDMTARREAVKTIVPAAYSALGAVLTLVASKVVKVPYQTARPIVDFNEQEVALLTEPTAKVLAKYVPSEFQYEAELELVLMLAAVTQDKIIALRAAMALQKENKTEPEQKPVAELVS